jgi:hypothetical protein
MMSETIYFERCSSGYLVPLLQMEWILITTKMGKKLWKKIAYNTYVGFQETSRTLPTLNATEYALLLK